MRVHWRAGGRAICGTQGYLVRQSADPKRVTCRRCLRLISERLPIVRDDAHLRLE